MLTFSKLGSYGRFGNMLWQVASTIGLANDCGQQYTFPKTELNDYFPIPTGKEFNYKFEKYVEKNPYYERVYFPCNKNWDLEGYFQSPEYFKHSKKEIISLFDMGNHPIKDAVSIHIRRGDYIPLSHIHINLEETKYYRYAMQFFPDDQEYVVFSDDKAFARYWIEKQARSKRFTLCTDNNLFNEFLFMSCCKDNIIANSSFSWWAAYLNKNESKRVIAPGRWVTNEAQNDRLLGLDWERIEI